MSAADKPPRNLVFESLPELPWKPPDRAASLDKVALYVRSVADKAMKWYLHRKERKRLIAQGLRSFAIAATALAGLIPLLAELFTTAQGQPKIAPAWASVALLLAGAAVGLDRFFGFSSAWMRFLTTQMQIHHALHAFLLDWESRRAAWEGKSDPGQQETEAGLKRSKDFLIQVDAILKGEMDTWVAEFGKALAEIDKAAKAQTEVMRLGAANVAVANGEKCAAGMRLAIDGGAEQTYHGKTMALRNLVPGAHTIKVRGRIGNKELQAEHAFKVAAGEVVPVDLTLQ